MSDGSELVPADMTYFEWLKTQPADFQDAAIGPKRGELLRNGGISAERFSELNLNRNFEPRTLKEMRKLEPLAFKRAGIGLAVSGAFNPNSDRAEAHAARYYEAIRNRTSDNDVKNIAKNINFPEKVVKDIKNQVFLNEHDLGDGDFGRFTPDYDMAQAMKRHGYDYMTAHDIANAYHNWESEIKKLKERGN